MPAQARGDGSEVRVTVGVEADELGVQDHAVPAQGLADGGKLGELASGVSTGARPQREPSAFDADLRANSVLIRSLSVSMSAPVRPIPGSGRSAIPNRAFNGSCAPLRTETT